MNWLFHNRVHSWCKDMALIHRREDWISNWFFPPKWQRISQWKNNTIHYSLDLIMFVKHFIVLKLCSHMSSHWIHLYKNIMWYTRPKFLLLILQMRNGNKGKWTLASGLHQHDRISETELAWKIRDREWSRTCQGQSLDSLEVSMALKFFYSVFTQSYFLIINFSLFLFRDSAEFMTHLVSSLKK